MRYPGQFHFRMSILTFMVGIPRKVPPESVDSVVLAEPIVTFEVLEVSPLIVSTEEVSTFMVPGPVEDAGIMEER